jgi:heme/copper-type cytochrome/quinol oxidase subunit 2
MDYMNMFLILLIPIIIVIILGVITFRAIVREQHRDDPHNTFSIVGVPFPTTPEQATLVPAMGTQMLIAGYAEHFVDETVDLAMHDQGVFDLLQMWATETDPSAREWIMSDIEDLVEDYETMGEW